MKDSKISNFSKCVLVLLIITGVGMLLCTYFHPGGGYNILPPNPTAEQIAAQEARERFNVISNFFSLAFEILLTGTLLINIYKGFHYENKLVKDNKEENNDSVIEELLSKKAACYKMIKYALIYFIVLSVLIVITALIKG